MKRDEVLEVLNTNLSDIKRFGVDEIGVFGSVARSEEQDDSDIDVLVHFKDGEKTFDNYMELKFFLEEKLTSDSVDLVIADSLKPQLKEVIGRETIYASRL